jgi:hypothetical protein
MEYVWRRFTVLYMTQILFDDYGVFDSGYDPNGAAALLTGFDADLEHASSPQCRR